jgi:hypothetical protein
MSTEDNGKTREAFKKAKDLRVIVKYERDDSPEGKLRIEQAKNIICSLILLSKKRGRPSKKEKEDFSAAA